MRNRDDSMYGVMDTRKHAFIRNFNVRRTVNVMYRVPEIQAVLTLKSSVR